MVRAAAVGARGRGSAYRSQWASESSPPSLVGWVQESKSSGREEGDEVKWEKPQDDSEIPSSPPREEGG